MFQSAPPRGDERRKTGHAVLRSQVSIRAPAWGRTTTRPSRPPWRNCFNPRPRVGTNIRQSVRPARADVSIRAPAWGRTWPRSWLASWSVFQSAPPRGDERGTTDERGQRKWFQSAPPRGDEPRRPRRPDQSRGGFNPRPRVGTNSGVGVMLSSDIEFQSAPPRGDEQHLAVALGSGTIVSIRAPAWGRTRSPPGGYAMVPFQSAPPRGDEHLVARVRAVWPDVSIRAPAWGRTSSPLSRMVNSKFQSAPPRGDERVRRVHETETKTFQSAPPRGDERPRHPRRRRDDDVSIRAPAWGRTKTADGTEIYRVGFNPRPRVGTNSPDDRLV